MRLVFLILILCVSGPAFSNGFRVCGWQDGGGRDLPEVEFSPEAVPFTVYLNWRARQDGREIGLRHCGGALVAPNWVVTARHCVGDRTWGALGVYTPATQSKTAGLYAVCPDLPPDFPREDIALLRLEAPVAGATLAPKIADLPEALPVIGDIPRWPIFGGAPARMQLRSAIRIEALGPTPMLRGLMVRADQRVPCGGESGSVLLDEGGGLMGVLTAIAPPRGGPPNCNDPGTRIFVTPLAGWRDWIDQVMLACDSGADTCAIPE